MDEQAAMAAIVRVCAQFIRNSGIEPPPVDRHDTDIGGRPIAIFEFVMDMPAVEMVKLDRALRDWLWEQQFALIQSSRMAVMLAWKPFATQAA
jgi:hypothetical protein